MRFPVVMPATRCALAALAAATTSCRDPTESLAARPHVVDVVMDEYRFDYRPPTEGGRVVFRVRNQGRLPHNLVLIELAEEIPPLDQQLRGSERLFVPPVASLPQRPPGRSGTFAVDLAPGRYGLVCFVQDPDGAQHAQKGMNSELRVR